MKKQWYFILLSFLLGNIEPSPAQGPSEDYIKMMNSYVPGSPEAAQIMKYVDFPISYSTGTANIEIPIYTVKGSGISIPISLSYHSGGGVTVDGISTEVGLGWSLMAGGEITREVRGKPDEGTAGVAGYFNKPHKISYYFNSYLQTAQSYADYSLWVDANSIVDLEPDIFYFSFGAYSGKFIYDDSFSVFRCITDARHLKISFEQSDKTWKIVSDDGTSYCFVAKVLTTAQTVNLNSSNTSGAGSPEITSWKLTKIINADATDSIMINYAIGSYSYYAPGANISYQTMPGSASGTPDREAINSFTKNYISGACRLESIVGKNVSVSFVPDNVDRLDLPFTKALSKVIIKDQENIVKDIFVLHHSNFERLSNLGTTPGGSDLAYSLRLDSISEYGISESNTNPLRHTFKYNSRKLPCRLSFAKDFWGYFNSNNYSATLAPKLTFVDGLIPYNFPGANRLADTAKISACILEEIGLPTGGSIHYNYESNDISYPVPEAAPDAIAQVSNHILVFKDSMETFDAVYKDTFIVNQSANAAMNFSLGGVYATISFSPKLSIQNSSYPNYNPAAGPYFELIKFAELPNSAASGGYYQIMQYEDLANVHLPNGYYVMIAHTNTLNNANSLNSMRVLNFTVNYSTVDNNQTNYFLAGLRVKSIVTKDQYSNTTKIRSFKYHDLETNASFGRYIGPSLSAFVEYGGAVNAPQRYLVRMGSNNLPGQGSSSNSVFYPTVIEEEYDNGQIFRTVHNYTIGVPFYPYYQTTWPFVPGVDVECARGNDSLIVYKRQTSAGFEDVQKTKKVYELQYSDPNSTLSYYTLMGIRCNNSSYDESLLGVQNFAPEHISPYRIGINRLYMTSDSTITYDLNNSSRSTTVWHDYTYGDNNMQPIVTRTGNSDGTVSTQKIWYPMDSPEPNSFINATLAAQMALANRITQPLGTTSYKDGTLLSQQYTYGHMDGSKLLTDSMTQAILNNAPETEIKVLTYDDYANPLTILLRGSKYRKYIWNKEKGLPLATAVMGTNSFFYFNSFEYGDGTAGAAFSGTKAYPLNSGALNFLSANLTAETDVYVWANSAAVYINGSAASSTGKTKGSWTLYTGHLSAGTSLSSISGSALIDQLIVLPSGSQFQGNVYDASGRVIAIANDQMSTAFFEYDHFGRLTSVRDEQGNIVKSSTYQIQGAQ